MQVLFSTFVFLINLWKVGTSWISRKRGILEKKGVWPPLPTMNSFSFNEVKQKSAGNSNPPCLKLMENLLGPATVMCSLRPECQFCQELWNMSNSFSVVYNRNGAFVFYKSSRSCFRGSGQSRSNFSIPLSLVNMVSPDTKSNIELLFDKNRNSWQAVLLLMNLPFWALFSLLLSDSLEPL